MATTVPEPKRTSRVEERPLSGNLGWLLAQASHVMTTEMTRAFERIGISPRGHCVLSAALGGEYTQKELAEIVGLDKTTMVVTVDQLERAGLAERRATASDRRARIIAVTRAGKKLVAEGEQVVTAVQRDILDSLPAGERKALMAALERLVADRLSTPVACSRAPRRRV